MVKLVEFIYFNLFLTLLTLVKGMVVKEVKNMRDREKGNNFKVLEDLQRLLPLTVDDVRAYPSKLFFF